MVKMFNFENHKRCSKSRCVELVEDKEQAITVTPYWYYVNY